MTPRRRIACLLLPDALVQAERRARPELEGVPFVVATGDDGRAEVVAVSAEAAHQGVRAQHTLAHARAACAELRVCRLSPALEASARQSLLDAALSVSPRAEPAPPAEAPFAAESAVFLDAAGTATLFETEAGFASALLARAGKLGLRGVVGIAGTRFASRALARRLALATGHTNDTDDANGASFAVIAPGEEARRIAELPIDLLGPSDALADRLTRFGIRRVRDLLRLPRRSLAQRLGGEAVALAARVRGETNEAPLPEPRDARIEEAADLEFPIATLEPLLFVMRGVLARLAERLAVRALAASRLDLELGLEGGARDARQLGLSAPTLDVRVWLRVATLELESHPPSAPIEALAVACEGRPQRRDQLDLFLPAGPRPEALDRTLAELASLCGDEAIGAPRVADVHRPDAWAIAPFAPHPASRAAPAQDAPAEHAEPAERLAVRALRPPSRAEVRVDAGVPVAVRSSVTSGTILRASGPWRTTGHWWSEEGRYALDHYDIQVSDGVVARLCFDWVGRSWRIDGLYD